MSGYRKKLNEVALPLEAIKGGGAREVDPPRAPLDTSPVVGAAALGRLPGGTLGLAGRRRIVERTVTENCRTLRFAPFGFGESSGSSALAFWGVSGGRTRIHRSR